MKNEKILFAMDGIGDDLITAAMEPRKQKRRPLLRWAAAAACVCLVLTATVGADTLGNVLEEVGKTFSSYRAPERYTSVNFSREAVDIAGEHSDLAHITVPMDTLAELEEFIGMEHFSNEILDQATPKKVTTYGQDDACYETAHNVLLSCSEGEILMALAESYYTVEQATVQVQYQIITENLDVDGGVAMAYEGTEGHTAYTTPSGMTCTVYTNTDEFFTDCTAFAAKGDCLLWVTVTHYDRDTAQTLIRQIMDAYT